MLNKIKKVLKLHRIHIIVNYFLVNKIYVGTNPKFFEKKRKLLNSIGHKIGNGTKIVGPIECYGNLDIGENCWIGKNFIVNGNGKVIMGNNCDIAPEVTVLTGGHKIGDSDRRAGMGESYIVTIGNGVWVGARSTLFNNIVVGDGSVIGACSCVNKNVSSNTLVGGIPIRVIRNLNGYEEN